MKTHKNLIWIILTILIVNSCAKNQLDEPIEKEQKKEEVIVDEGPLAELTVPVNFSYATSKDINVNLKVPSFLNGAAFSLYATQKDRDSLKIATASFDNNGTFNSSFTIAFGVDSIMVLSNYVGLTNKVMISINNDNAIFDYSSFYEREEVSKTSKSSYIPKKITMNTEKRLIPI